MDIGGFDIPTWMIVAGVVAVLLYMILKRRK